MKKLIFLFACVFAFTFAFTQKGYEIKVKINGFKDTTLILGHHFAKSMYPDDTIRIDKNGVGVFKGKEVLPEGMYIIFLPSKTYFDIIVDKDQFFTVENDTSDLFKNIKFTGSAENQLFYDYQKFLGEKRDEAMAIHDQRKKAKTDAEKKVLTDKLKTIDDAVKAFRDKAIKENPSSFIAKFIKATQDIEVPDFPRDEKGNVKDSSFQYKYYKKHYFDNFDVSDVRLLRTPLYEDKILNYIDKVVVQIPDSINVEIDTLIKKSRTSPELFRYMLVTLFNHYGQSQIMGFDAIALYIADKYYIKEATWSDTTYINKLKNQVAKQMPLLLGKKAPNIRLVDVPAEHFIAAADSAPLKKNVYVGQFFNLYDIPSDFTVLVFWEADCGHCKKSMPILKNIYPKLKAKNAEIVSVSLLFGEEGKVKWVDYINENKMYDWINAWNPYEYKFKELYDVTSTPQVFILDKDHKIIGKRIGPEQVEEIINHYIEVQKLKK